MPEQPHEAHFQDLLAKGMAGPEEVAEARRLLAEAAAGAELSVTEALLRAGVKAARAHHAALAPAADAATASAEETAAAAMPTSDLEVLEKLGRGSQAVVFKCRQISMDRIVAAKILLARGARESEARERFLREARQAANLAHPNIVTIHQILPFKARSASGGEPIDTFCIVMEYVDGGSVAELLAARKRFDPAEAACIIRPVAEALAFAHKRGIIHRDVKPGNILLTQGGLVKLADLGLALPLADAQEASQAGRAYGTPYYISPEQVRGDPDIDFRADLYSLAATFYEMVAGVPPFTAPTPQEVMRKHLTDNPPDPRKHVPELPGALCWMLARAMAKDRLYRYESAEDFIGALDKLFPAVDATVAGASGAAGKLAAADDSAVALPVADPTVPAADALREQLAAVPQTERSPRRPVAEARAQKAGGKPGASVRAAGAKPARAAPEAPRDPRQERRRNILVISVVGGLAVLALAAAVVLFLVFPPPEDLPTRGAPARLAAGKNAVDGEPGTPADAPPTASSPEAKDGDAPAPGASPSSPDRKVGVTPEVSKPVATASGAGASNPDLTVGARTEPAKPPEPPPPPPKSPEPPSEPPPAPPKVEKAPEPPPANPADTKPSDPPPAPGEAITVKAAKAEVHGDGAKYEPPDKTGIDYRDNIGFWHGADTYVTWDATVPEPGTYEVHVTYSRDKIDKPGEYTVEIAGRKLKAKAEATGGWAQFVSRKIGSVSIAKAGPVTITVRPVMMPKGGGLMNLQAVTLLRTGK